MTQILPAFSFQRRIFTLWDLFSFEVKAKKKTVFVWTSYCEWYIWAQTKTWSFFLRVSRSCLWKFMGNFVRFMLWKLVFGTLYFKSENNLWRCIVLKFVCDVSQCFLFWALLELWSDCLRKFYHPVLGSVRETFAYMFSLTVHLLNYLIQISLNSDLSIGCYNLS